MAQGDVMDAKVETVNLTDGVFGWKQKGKGKILGVSSVGMPFFFPFPFYFVWSIAQMFWKR